MLYFSKRALLACTIGQLDKDDQSIGVGMEDIETFKLCFYKTIVSKNIQIEITWDKFGHNISNKSECFQEYDYFLGRFISDSENQLRKTITWTSEEYYEQLKEKIQTEIDIIKVSLQNENISKNNADDIINYAIILFKDYYEKKYKSYRPINYNGGAVKTLKITKIFEKMFNEKA